MDEVSNDSRFSHILKDPRFKNIPKKHMKVKIDKRFQSMFHEKKFQIKCAVDKRGRKVELGGSDDLKRYYALSDSDDEDNEKKSDEEDGDNERKSDKENKDDEKSEESESSENSDENSDKKVEKKQNQDVIKISKVERKTITPEIKQKLRDLNIDYARGEGVIFSDSSSDEETSEEEDDYFEIDHDWGELDKDAEHTDEATNRLAVCNMNWDRIEAADLMVLFNSFLPPGGLIHSVTIYPSEFGLQRMKEEEENGPMELMEEIPEGKNDEISQLQMEKLRTYQLNRLKYYYAVVVCDTKNTADALYKECDGLEYESSSSKLDLRFIPDDTTFDQEPKETCTSLPDLETYKPKLFMTSALTKAKCNLTWDENDPNREDIVKSIHSGKVDENQLKKYLACSSSEDESENEKKGEKTNQSTFKDIDKYKALLAEIENKEKNSKKNKVNLEVTWNLKLENKASEIVKEAVKEKEKKTPFQQYLEKRKEKKKKKREERIAQSKEANGGSEDSAFSDDDIPSDIDLNDPYYKEEFEASKTKKSSKTKKIKKEVEDENSKQKKAELELLLLDSEPANLKHFSLKKIEESEKASKKKKKGKKRKAEETIDEANEFQDDFKIDVNDERFSALYSSHHFNIDPADPQFRPTKATKELIEEKLRRREAEELLPKQVKKELETKKPRNAELSILVKNIIKNTSEISKKV